MDPTPIIQDLLFNKGVLGVCLALMFLYFCFQGWHFRKLLSEEPDKHKPVFDEAKSLIKSEHWGTRYRVFLKKILAKLTDVIGDHHRFPDELPAKPRFKADDPELERLHKQDTLRRIFGVNPFTIESYQFCFLLALMYPVMSFMMGWVIGGNGSFGGFRVLPDHQPFFTRLGMIIMMVAVLFSVWLIVWKLKLLGWKSSVVFVSVALVIALTFTNVVIGSSKISVVVVVIFVGILAGFYIAAVTLYSEVISDVIGVVVAGGIASAFTIAFFLTTVTMIAMVQWLLTLPLMLGLYWVTIWFYKAALRRKLLAAYWLIYSLVFLVASLALMSWMGNTNAVLMLFFYLILPLANTPLDWLSLGVTRALLQSIRFNQHRAYKALIWSFLDLLMAVTALSLVSCVTVGVVSLVNLLAVKPIIDLGLLFKSLSHLENWKDNLWIYFMLFSTLIPTVLHFALAGGALTLAVSKKKRMETLKDIETNNLSANKAWLYISVMPAFGFVLAPALLLSGLYWLLHVHGAFLGNGLLAWTEVLATLIDPSLGQLPKM